MALWDGMQPPPAIIGRNNERLEQFHAVLSIVWFRACEFGIPRANAASFVVRRIGMKKLAKSDGVEVLDDCT